jgi:hypothetical protein
MPENSNTDPFQEVIQIKKAKRRLLGSIIILISLVIFSIFFLQDRSIEKNSADIKINFTKKNYDFSDNELSGLADNIGTEIKEENTSDEIVLESKKISANESKVSGFYIQFGIFQSKQSAESMVGKLSALKIESLIDDMVLEKKFKVRSEYFPKKEDLKYLSEISKNNKINIIIKEANK